MHESNILVKVTYAEVDFMKVVHNANYFEYFERGRLDFLAKNIMPYKEMVENKKIQIPVTANTAKYFRPAFYDDTLQLITRLEGHTNKRIRFIYQMFKKNILICEGTSEHAFIVNGVMKAVEIPELFTSYLNKAKLSEC